MYLYTTILSAMKIGPPPPVKIPTKDEDSVYFRGTFGRAPCVLFVLFWAWGCGVVLGESKEGAVGRGLVEGRARPIWL